MKSNKIGLVVEGLSEKKFFEDYFKKRYPDFRGMKVIPSSTAGKCKIQEVKKVKSKIEDLRDKKCDEIYILIDLDSKCLKEKYDCVVTLKNDYIAKLKLNKDKDVKVIVLSSELEAWMLSAWEKSDKKSKEDLKRYFGLKSSQNLEENLIKKFLSSQQNINYKNNESLKYFLCKLEILKSPLCK